MKSVVTMLRFAGTKGAKVPHLLSSTCASWALAAQAVNGGGKARQHQHGAPTSMTATWTAATTMQQVHTVTRAAAHLSKYTSLNNAKADAFIKNSADVTQPDSIVVVEGTTQDATDLQDILMAHGTMKRLNPDLRPNSFLALSTPEDTKRVESQTYICTQKKEDAGVTNNWTEPEAIKDKFGLKGKDGLFTGSMTGRTMYVIPYLMGPAASPLSKVGLEVTDSPYVALSMMTMTRVGGFALDEIKGGSQDFVRGLHTVGVPLKKGEKDVPWPCNTTKYIVHFPEELSIVSYGSGYGGNSLLGKKCHALRLASYQGKQEEWLAEHMVILGMKEKASGRKKYFAAAFPSACGKTNLAMIESAFPEYEFTTVGDDIAWMKWAPDGTLRAINPRIRHVWCGTRNGAQHEPSCNGCC